MRAPEISWQQAERNSLEDFVDDRARDFVGRQAVIARLTSLCLSPAQDGAPWGVCVTGEPGSGKSALFGELLRRMKDTDAFVLAHAAGTSPRASSVGAMLRRWIDELASALGAGDVDLAENVDPETVKTAFASLLGRMTSQQRVVVLIDALDQFKKTSRGHCDAYATWVPGVSMKGKLPDSYSKKCSAEKASSPRQTSKTTTRKKDNPPSSPINNTPL